MSLIPRGSSSTDRFFRKLYLFWCGWLIAVSGHCDPLFEEAPLLPKLRGYFAEFLRENCLAPLCILYLPTCVGFGYRYPLVEGRSRFSWEYGMGYFSAVAPGTRTLARGISSTPSYPEKARSERKLVMLSATGLSPSRVQHSTASPSSMTLVLLSHNPVFTTAGDKLEEGEDDVKSSCPLCPGRHTCYNGRDKGSRSREGELTPKPVLSSDCRLQLACMKPESLVIAGQPYGGEFVPGPCTHRPSHYGSWPCPKLLP
ncbi:hypothetical protein M5K25_012026 [Dendrobium thyrsiflorum]|uniref:Uncharacterized protein n=2 Tax=Magnoliopsida TaxID=3398 RepID=A0ABD0V483_DENTH